MQAVQYYVDYICLFIVEELHAGHGPKRRESDQVLHVLLTTVEI